MYTDQEKMINTLVSEYGGQIVFDDLSLLNLEDSLGEQVESLKEDLFQATFSKDRILDIGWYPSFDVTGRFHVKLIENYDWDNPLFSETANDFDDLLIVVESAVKKTKV
jgi:hypothetical protein